jgi:BirA family biotin operon repressor/biotin-[acetyl-CoA-carboxylase] ligase
VTIPEEGALSDDAIKGLLRPATSAALAELTVLDEVDSTNAALARLPAPRRRRHAMLAESQTQGRGRRQRGWHSPAGGNIYLSLAWRFDTACGPLSTLPLAAAVCLARALQRAGLRGHGIKWPNDILVSGSKLAGILVETQSPGPRAIYAIVGIGLNVRMPPDVADESIGRPWTDLAAHLSPELRDIDRNALAAMMLDELVHGLGRFESAGFEPFRPDWERYDLLRGRRVRIDGGTGVQTGTSLGIAQDGGLSVAIDDVGTRILRAEEVSIFDE